MPAMTTPHAPGPFLTLVEFCDSGPHDTRGQVHPLTAAVHVPSTVRLNGHRTNALRGPWRIDVDREAVTMLRTWVDVDAITLVPNPNPSGVDRLLVIDGWRVVYPLDGVDLARVYEARAAEAPECRLVPVALYAHIATPRR
jgi:hypothetical protein